MNTAGLKTRQFFIDRLLAQRKAGSPPVYSPRQIETLRFQNYMKMSWIAFYTILASFSVCLLCFILDVFYFKTGVFTKVVFLSLAGILGFGFNRIFSFLFPDNKRTQ
jgi:hypothetical protein